MRAKPFVPRVRVKRVSTTCQLRKMVSLLPVLLFLPKLKSYCLLYGLALPGLLITFHLTLISDAPCYVFVLSAIFTFSWRGVSFCLHRHRLNRTTRPASGFTYTTKKSAVGADFLKRAKTWAICLGRICYSGSAGYSSRIPNPAISLTGRENRMAPASESGPAWRRMVCMISALRSVGATIRMTSFSEAIETL